MRDFICFSVEKKTLAEKIFKLFYTYALIYIIYLNISGMTSFSGDKTLLFCVGIQI